MSSIQQWKWCLVFWKHGQSVYTVYPATTEIWDMYLRGALTCNCCLHLSKSDCNWLPSGECNQIEEIEEVASFAGPQARRWCTIYMCPLTQYVVIHSHTLYNIYIYISKQCQDESRHSWCWIFLDPQLNNQLHVAAQRCKIKHFSQCVLDISWVGFNYSYLW